MLFAMYENHKEKAAPDTYNGLPICNRDDLMYAIEDAAGSELRKLVEKYLDKVERQAQAKVDEKMEEAEQDAAEADAAVNTLYETKRALCDAVINFSDVLFVERLNRNKLEKVHQELSGIYRRLQNDIKNY